jgi:hypothetical protein
VSFFRLVRILVLLTILVIVAGTQWLSARQLASWEKPVWVTIYPVVDEGAETARRYASSLRPETFEDLNRFLGREARRNGLVLDTPLVFQVAPTLGTLPPPVPADGDRLAIAIWSLKMRWWAWRRDREDSLPSGDLQVFMTLNPIDTPTVLDRSVGLQKAGVGIVNGYASRSMAAVNRVVLAHELLHLFGATDKYDRVSGQPLEPMGLGRPDQQPRYPQKMAEIMSGRVATSRVSAVMPRSLDACLVGELTATEIGWR